MRLIQSVLDKPEPVLIRSLERDESLIEKFSGTHKINGQDKRLVEAYRSQTQLELDPPIRPVHWPS